MQRQAISVVIPAYNEEKSLGLVIEQTTQVLDSLQVPYEIIVVDDGSIRQHLKSSLNIQSHSHQLPAKQRKRLRTKTGLQKSSRRNNRHNRLRRNPQTQRNSRPSHTALQRNRHRSGLTLPRDKQRLDDPTQPHRKLPIQHHDHCPNWKTRNRQPKRLQSHQKTSPRQNEPQLNRLRNRKRNHSKRTQKRLQIPGKTNHHRKKTLQPIKSQNPQGRTKNPQNHNQIELLKNRTPDRLKILFFPTL